MLNESNKFCFFRTHIIVIDLIIRSSSAAAAATSQVFDLEENTMQHVHIYIVVLHSIQFAH